MNVTELNEIINNAIKGDKSAMAELYSASYNDIYYFALNAVKDPTIAEDILQEVAIEMINSISNLNEPEKYKSWILTITYRKCGKYFKKQNDEVLSAEDENEFFENLENENQEFIPDAELDNEEFKSTILDMINSLSDEQRTATLLYYFNEMSVSEIARVQNVQEGTVKSRLSRARNAIKTSIMKYEKDHGVKLYSVGTLPLMAWFFKSYASASQMSQVSAEAAACVAAETIGVSVDAINLSGVAVSNVSVASASTGVLGKIAALSFKTKLTASIVIGVVGLGGSILLVSQHSSEEIVVEASDEAASKEAKKEETAKEEEATETAAVEEGTASEEVVNEEETTVSSQSTSNESTSNESNSSSGSSDSSSNSGSSSSDGSSSSKSSTPAPAPAPKPEPKPEPTPPPVEEKPETPSYPEGRNAQEQEVINIAKSYGYTVKQSGSGGDYDLNIYHPTNPKLGVTYSCSSNGNEYLATYWNTTDSTYKNFVYDVCYAIGYPGSKQEMINAINNSDGMVEGEGYWFDTSGDFLSYGTV